MDPQTVPEIVANGTAHDLAQEATRHDVRVLTERLALLQKQFALSPIECEILSVCFRFNVDAGFRLHIAETVHAERRSFWRCDEFVQLLASDAPQVAAVLAAFTDSAPLLYWRFLESQPHDPDTFRLSPRIRGFLAGVDCLGEALVLPWRPVDTSSTSHAVAGEPLPAALAGLAQRWRNGSPEVTIFEGAASADQEAVAYALAAPTGCELAVVSLQSVNVDSPESIVQIVQLALREAKLRGAVLFLQSADVFAAPDAESLWAAVAARIEAAAIPCIISTTRPLPADPLRIPPFVARFEIPPAAERLQYWRNLPEIAGLEDSALATLANGFRFSRRKIERALSRALRSGTELSLDSLAAACRAESAGALAVHGTKIEAHYTWDDLVLQADTIAQLREVATQMRLRHRVQEDWGYGRASGRTEGVHAFFYGPPGTGKTMAASVIAAELRLELFRINLAAVVSKYVGETEKNLERIFAAAEGSNAILFFDEADALFGKRSEVRDAHDRYANIEVAYLLQRIETFGGMTLLASNLDQNVDEAFRRRMHYIIEFPPPNETERERLWRLAIQPGQPIAEPIDYGFLAAKLTLSGAEIKNVATRAAYLAAAEATPLELRHLLHAARREYQKTGKNFLDPELVVAAGRAG